MTPSTTPTHDSDIEACRRKRHFPSKRSAKEAARHFSGPTNVYECPHPNPDGSEGTHWHISRRRPSPGHARRAG